MSDRVLRLYAASTLAAALILSVVPASAQSGDAKPAEKPKAQTETPAKDAAGSKKAEELADTAKAINGPAGNPECVWLGRRVVNLLWRDDLDTAFRHLDLYDRFGCPGGHIQATFRCVVRQGAIDPKAPESLNARVQACWINPATQPAPPAAAQNPAAPTGTSTQ
jgi:hypothetical protein